MTSSLKTRWQLCARLFSCLAILFAMSGLAGAQEASRPDRGVMPNGSYSVSDIENINVLNGNVNIRIPLASLPPIAGGKLSWTISAQYNSKAWNVTRYQQNDDPLTWQPYNIETPGTDAGWSIGNTYTMFFATPTMTSSGSGIRVIVVCPHGISISSTTTNGGRLCCECLMARSTSFGRQIRLHISVARIFSEVFTR